MTDESIPLSPSAPAPPSPVALQLQRTQPWVRFLSVMGFVAAGFMVLFGLVAGAAGAATGRLETLGLMIMYPVLGVLYVFPSLYLLRYADRIKTFMSSRDESDLAQALDAQRSFWKFAGIWTIVTLVLAVVGIVIGMAIAIFMGMKAGSFSA